MNNYKIKVNNGSESKEAQELFFELGYGFEGNKIREVQNLEFFRYFYLFAYGDDCNLTYSSDCELFNSKPHREITLAELRDMVVLKRNDVNDATHTDQDDWKWYISSKGDGYVWQCGNSQQLKQWDKASLDLVDLKPIEKNMKKEYLFKQISGDYKLVDHDCQGRAIEIPEGANILADIVNDLVFYKSGNPFRWWNGERKEWNNCADIVNIDVFKNILWQRPIQTEELPFIDDEPQSLNDQYDEIEQVRQAEIHGTVESNPDFDFEADHPKHSHYFISVSDVNEVDFYEIALRYNVTDPCIQHILKKCLAIGNRGHKDFIHDLQDIFDTAARALAIHNR